MDKKLIDERNHPGISNSNAFRGHPRNMKVWNCNSKSIWVQRPMESWKCMSLLKSLIFFFFNLWGPKTICQLCSNCVYKFGIPDYNLDFVKDFTNVYQNIMWPSVEKFRLGIKLGEFITGGVLHQKRLLNIKTHLIICPEMSLQKS